MANLATAGPGTAARRAASTAACAGALLCAGLPTTGRAAELPLWEAGLGATALHLPHYRGADQAHNGWLPLPYFVVRGDILRADRHGTRALLLDTDALDVDLSLALSPPTRSADNAARRGMANLAPTFELGPNASWHVARGAGWKLDLRLPVRAVTTLEARPQWIGWTAAPSVNLDIAGPAGWNVGALAGPLVASRRLNGYYYDVADPDVRPDRAAYRASGGYAGSQFVVALSRRREQLWLGAFVRIDTLRGAQFADSPLVRQRDNLSIGVAAAWVFARSDRTVNRAE